jgi:MarR family transcriptional regulator, organic hydroperoxide resistance regulator
LSHSTVEQLKKDGGRVPDRPREEKLEGELNICIMDGLAELFKRAAALGQGLAQRYGLSMTDLAGLHKLEEPMTMKELGLRMHCDPSFVTMVANGLEKRGLARRETSERDKRIKVMRLTDEGISMRERLEKEFSTRMPWATALSAEERKCLFALLGKLAAAADVASDCTGGDPIAPVSHLTDVPRQ